MRYMSVNLEVFGEGVSHHMRASSEIFDIHVENGVGIK